MEHIRAYTGKVLSFLRAHKSARIACIALGILLALWLILHPYGTKTFLLLGVDSYGSVSEEGRSDVTMLVQVDFTKLKISAVTFARDMFIENDTGYLTKINTIVRRSDEAALCDLIEKNFGVDIDGWFRVNFTTVVQLVNAIGGVEVELTQAEVNYLNKVEGYYYENPIQEGLSRLNGGQALAYARCRKLDNDLGRGERQGKLLSAMVKQTRKMTAANVVAVFKTLRHAWSSSYSMGEQVKLMLQALWLRGAKVQHIGVPFDGTWGYGNAGETSGVVANLETNKQLLLEALGLPAPKADTSAQ